MKRLADSDYQKRADEIDGQYSHIHVNELTFHMMRGEDRSAYLRIYTQWAEEKVQARLETYRNAFRKENVMPSEADLSEMSSAFDEIISNLSPSVPAGAKTVLQQIGQRIIRGKLFEPDGYEKLVSALRKRHAELSLNTGI